jgi:drug/metabolite transporter (DMT)-like permease
VLRRIVPATKGLLLGFVGMLLFALTLPFTKLAIAAFNPLLITFGRAVVAALLGAAFLCWTRAPWPQRTQVGALALVVLGNVIGFPLFLGLALALVPAHHAAVITGLLPLTTAVFAVLLTHERPSIVFWMAALAGCALVMTYAAQTDGGLVWADAWLLAAMLLASVGYVAGAKITPILGGLETMSWAAHLAGRSLCTPARGC